MDSKYVGKLLLDDEEGWTWCQIPAKVSRLNILDESFCLFHEHIKYYFAHLNSSVSLKPCLIEKFCIDIWIQQKKVFLSSPIGVCGTKKKLHFVDWCYYCQIWTKLQIFWQIYKKNAQISHFMKICPMGAKLLKPDGWTDRHDEANGCFFAILRMCLKTKCMMLLWVRLEQYICFIYWRHNVQYYSEQKSLTSACNKIYLIICPSTF